MNKLSLYVILAFIIRVVRSMDNLSRFAIQTNNITLDTLGKLSNSLAGLLIAKELMTPRMVSIVDAGIPSTVNLYLNNTGNAIHYSFSITATTGKRSNIVDGTDLYFYGAYNELSYIGSIQLTTRQECHNLEDEDEGKSFTANNRSSEYCTVCLYNGESCSSNHYSGYFFLEPGEAYQYDEVIFYLVYEVCQQGSYPSHHICPGANGNAALSPSFQWQID